MMMKRLKANGVSIPGALNLVRAMSTELSGRVKYYSKVRAHLDRDMGFRAYFEQESHDLPGFYLDHMKRDLASFWPWLPEEAVHHDPYAYLNCVNEHMGAHGNGNGHSQVTPVAGKVQVRELGITGTPR
jgi:hypothetical protein